MCVCVFVTWSLASKNRIVDLPSINDIKGGADVLRYVERKVVVPWLPLPLSKQSTMGTEIFGLTPWDGCYPPASSTQAPVAGETGCISGIAALWKIDRSPWSICGLQLDTHCHIFCSKITAWWTQKVEFVTFLFGFVFYPFMACDESDSLSILVALYSLLKSLRVWTWRIHIYSRLPSIFTNSGNW